MCQVWLKMAQWFWRRRLQVFTILQLSPLLEGRDPSFKKELESSSLVENGPVVLEKKILKSSQCIFIIFQLFPLSKGCSPSFEQIWIPFTQECFCKVWLKLDQWWCRRKSIKVFNVFLLFHNYLPFEKSVALYMNKLESPSPKDALCEFFFKISPVVHETEEAF